MKPRIGRITVEAAFPNIFDIGDMIYRGTVLGPPLWSAFFHDIEGAAIFEDESASIFADDLNIFQIFLLDVTSTNAFEIVERTRDMCINGANETK